MIEAKIKNKEYKTNNGFLQVIQCLEFKVSKAECIGIVGPSGCGKTTLLRMICGLDREYQGEIRINGQAAREDCSNQCSLVFQQGTLLPWKTVEDNLRFALGNENKDSDVQLLKILEWVGLRDVRRFWPKQLSGGMRQRVALARALAVNNPILLMDEPFAAVDAIQQYALQDLLCSLLADNQRTAVLVTHNVEEAVYVCDKIMVLSSRPSKMLEMVPIDLPRPRDRNSTAVLGIRQTILGLLRAENQQK
jgi:ABC-type nitrate/sulfonate/bicarbonate transport system ATPase subunit